MKKKITRPAIPIKTQMKLWTLSAGRCEFLGCNEIVWRDSLTFTEGNYSNIAHIISWTPTGPRGDQVFSPKLATNFNNLMLVCGKHGKMIDEKNNIDRYTIDKLQSFKSLHEERIKIQTSVKEARKSTVIRLQSNIRGRRVEVSQSDVYIALLEENRYPADEKGILIDLTSLDYSADNSFWETARRQIDSKIDREFSQGNDELRHKHLSIFGLAPIPLLVYFGFRISNTVPSEIYIKTREKNWHLGLEAGEDSKTEFKIIEPEFSSKPKEVVLSVAVSGSNSEFDIRKAIEGNDFPVYELRAIQPGIDFIKSSKDLENFRQAYRMILDKIREQCGKEVVIHLLAAVPSCAAIILGREVLHGVDPPILVYEHGDQSSGFFRVIEVNNYQKEKNKS